MEIGVAQPLQLRRAAGRPVPRDVFAKPRPSVSRNALLGMGLWALLWLGYNTDLMYLMAPDFPSSTMNLIHGVRALFPALVCWFALLMVFARAKRVLPWIFSPLGMILMYTVAGLISSATLSVYPLYATYHAVNYLAMVMVLLAIVLVDNPLPDLLKVLKLTWIVGIIITFGLLGAIPLLGAGAMVETEGTPVGPRVRLGGKIAGMDSSRNTGFARYAAISALVALAGVLRKGRLRVRIAWGLVLGASLYALYLANGRTETLAFVASLAVILGAERAKRVVNILAGIGAALLLGLRGFYSAFFLYITRTGHVDPTLTGRTQLWEGGWRLLTESPWVGLGFMGDRYSGVGHMHNAFLGVLVQAGCLGGTAILIGLLIVWHYIIKYFFRKQPKDKSLIPPEIPAVFLFVTFSSLTESTFAYFSAAWLLSAPIVAYVVALHRHLDRIAAKAAQERALRIRSARRNLRDLRFPLDVAPSTPARGKSPD